MTMSLAFFGGKDIFNILDLNYLRIRIRICLFSYAQKKIQDEKYKLKCYNNKEK